jgi:hypothetical protein
VIFFISPSRQLKQWHLSMSQVPEALWSAVCRLAVQVFAKVHA